MKYNLTSKPLMPILRGGFQEAMPGTSDFAATCCKIHLGMLIDRLSPEKKNLIGSLDCSNRGQWLFFFSENRRDKMLILEKPKEVGYGF